MSLEVFMENRIFNQIKQFSTNNKKLTNIFQGEAHRHHHQGQLHPHELSGRVHGRPRQLLGGVHVGLPQHVDRPLGRHDRRAVPAARGPGRLAAVLHRGPGRRDRVRCDDFRDAVQVYLSLAEAFLHGECVSAAV